VKPIEAEKLLGGHATGTLTLEERQKLYAAALGHQDLFDALMDEEILRELLADPEAKAQLLAALAPAAGPRVVPFWRRTGVLGAAAGLLMAATAGLVVLRGPEKVPPTLSRELPKAPEAKALETKPPAQSASAPLKEKALASAKEPPRPVLTTESAPPPPPPAPAAPAQLALTPAAAQPAPAREESHWAQANDRRLEAQDQLKKAEASRDAAGMRERDTAQPAEVRAQAAKGFLSALPGSTAGGAVSVTASADKAAKARADAPTAAQPKAKAARSEGKVAATAPTWKLEPLSDGSTRVLVKGPAGAQAVVLRRGASGVQVLVMQLIDPGGDMAWWRTATQLTAGDVLDLYLLNAPVPEPAKLAETGPVDGFRARIHPAEKK
jgi:hypothetical protein